MANISLVYSTAVFDCYQATKTLPVWISKPAEDERYVLFGYGCDATASGFDTALVSGLLLFPKDLQHLQQLSSSQTLSKALADSMGNGGKKIEFHFPDSEVVLVVKCHPMYGRMVTFRQEMRFATLYYRRFRELLPLMGIQYIDASTPENSLPAHLRDRTVQEVVSRGCDFVRCPNFGSLDIRQCGSHIRNPLATLNY